MLPVVITRFIVPLASILASIRYGFGIVAYRTANKLERPSYTVLRTLPGNIEIRRYDPYLVAETEYEASPSEDRFSASDGFRRCARYIFGKNAGSSKMEMTAPVRIMGEAIEKPGEKMEMTAPVRISNGASTSSSTTTKVSFVMGKDYTAKTAPKPLDKEVTVRTVPGHVLAVRRFSGAPPKERRVAKERKRIEIALEGEGLGVAKGGGSETLVYGYHDPFLTPNFLRRNEVAVFVDERGL